MLKEVVCVVRATGKIGVTFEKYTVFRDCKMID